MMMNRFESGFRKEYVIGVSTLMLIVIIGIWVIQRDWSGGPKEIDAADAQFVEAGPYDVAVSVEPNAPQVGTNHLVIQVRTKEGEPVTDAEVVAVAEMPAMGSMAAMHAQADIVEMSPGVYQGELELPMAGEWPLVVEIVVGEDRHIDLTYEMATGRLGLQLATATPTTTDGTAYYTCPMHPSVRAAEPGQCPICGMDLVPVSQEEIRTGSIMVDEGRRQAIGVKTGVVAAQSFQVPIRLQGKIIYDPSRLTDISLRFGGWIGDLTADFEGKVVKRGDVLFTVYSPELLSLQEEFLQTLQRNRQGGSLLAASRKRLRLWGLSDEQIDWLEKKNRAQDYVPIFAPRDGVVIEKSIVNGSSFSSGERLLRVADLTEVWVEAYAYERDLRFIERGMAGVIKQPYLPEEAFPAEVMHVDPFVGETTRTARVRLRVSNESGALKPGTFANVYVEADLGERLVIPEDAVLVSGDKRIVFRDLGDGRLQPQEIITGYSNGEQVVVLKGLQEGDAIVTSGNFLIASESKLRAGINQW